MIKVLHLVSSLSYSSGLMSVIMNYYRFINKNEIQFGFMYFKDFKDESFLREIKSLGGETFLINKPTMSNGYLIYLRNYISKNVTGYSVLHLHELYLGFMFIDICKKCGIEKVVGHAHTTKFSDHPISSLRNMILCKMITKKLDGKLACSENAGITYYGKKNSFDILNNAFEYNRFYFNPEYRATVRNSLNVGEDTFVIGNIGRTSKQKNQSFLLDIFASIVKARNNSVLVIIGEGPLLVDLKDKAKKLKIENKVVFLSPMSDVFKLYSAFDAFVLPSLFEGLGIVLVEAQANGLPCYASDNIPLEAKLLDNYNMISLKCNAEYWAAKILIGNRLSKGIDEIFNKSRFNILNQVSWLESFYKELLER